MSAFNALNLTLHDEQLEAEEHSRELQIEDSFKIFQNALFDLKAKRFEDADAKFVELLNMDVIKPDKWGIYRYSSPTLDSLRYLAYRNRGMYYYSFLMENHTNMEPQDVVDNLLKVVENLVEAIQHSEADSSLTELLVQIFQSYKTKRLERLMLEYEVTRQENHLLLLGRKKRGILPKLKEIIGQYEDLLGSIKDDQTWNLLQGKKFMQKIKSNGVNEPRLNPLFTRIKEMKTHDEKAMKELDVFEIYLENANWEDIAKSLTGLIPHVKTSTLLIKSVDPYNDVEFPIEAVRFILQDAATDSTHVEDVTEDDDKGSSETLQISNVSEVAESIVADSDPKGDCQEEESNSNKRSGDHLESQKFVQRSSKRFREKDPESGEDDISKAHQDFLDEFSALLHTIGYEVPFSGDLLTREMQFPKDEALLKLYDLLECLKNWSSWHTDIFMQNDVQYAPKTANDSNDGEVLQLNTLLKSNVLGDKSNFTSYLQDLKNEKVDLFISSVNENSMHFQEVRFKFLVTLLSAYDDSGKRLVVDRLWSSTLFNSVEWLFLGTEHNLFEFMNSNLRHYPCLALSIYELLVNKIGSVFEEIEAKKMYGHKTTDLKNQRNRLEIKHNKWFALLNQHRSIDEKWNIQFEWSNYCYLQYSCDIIDGRLLSALHSIKAKLKKLSPMLSATYPNFSHIPCLSLDTVNSQIRKINIIRKISIVDASEDEEKTEDAEKHIGILQHVLLESLYSQKESSSEDHEMLTFIYSSPFLLKVKLWEVLFSFYIKRKDRENILRNYFHILNLFAKVLASGEYTDQPDKGRQQMLLTILCTIDNFTSKLIDILARENWCASDITVSSDNFKLLVQVFYLFYPILYYENSTRNDPSCKSFFRRAIKSSSKMKDIIANLATVLIFFGNIEASSKIPAQQGLFTTNMICCFHALLGSYKFCDASGGNFLKISENMLCRFVDNESLLQLKQILWCRYHYVMAGDNFNPEQHPTKDVKMEKSNSLPLGIYLIKLHYQDKNPLLASGNKTTLKLVLDNIIDALGDPLLFGGQIVARNKYLLKEYLDTPITAQLFRNAFIGRYKLCLTTPNDELQDSMNAGLFYVSSIQALNLYRNRKKSTQARPSELDSIIAMLKNDIIYNTKRFESWYLLGKCYAFIVEDDLIWTSDKLTVPDKKNATALTQRKAILCYIMSITLYYAKKVKVEEDKIILEKALEELGAEMISGYYKPMEKLCYIRRSASELKLSDSGELIKEKFKDQAFISDFNIEQAILLCFHRGNDILTDLPTGETNGSWINYYHIGRLLFKTDKNSYGLQAYKNTVQSCLIASKSSSPKDPIIEPHYYLVNICFKFVKYEIYDPTDALKLLSADDTFFKEDEAFWRLDDSLAVDYQKKVFYEKIIKLLNFLIASDKRKWHHRPRYRIARILFDEFNDADGALNEMGGVMSIKSAHKNLVNIWKPDFERPGKHFVYTYQYVIFYLDILFSKKDYNSIGLVCKKIRRFGSGMAYVNKASEHAVMLYTQCVRAKLQVDEKEYVEHLLPSLNYQSFVKTSETLFKTFKKDDYSDETLNGLKIAYQLKKGNNGIAFDGVCLSIYFKFFYLPLSSAIIQEDLAPRDSARESEQDEPGVVQIQVSDAAKKKVNNNGALSPTPGNHKPTIPRKRVSKKDAFDRIRLLVEKIT